MGAYENKRYFLNSVILKENFLLIKHSLLKKFVIFIKQLVLKIKI
jgi:hypothetical protein